jgi:hypothetical protein
MSWVGKKSHGCGVAAAEVGMMERCMVDRVRMRVRMLDSLVDMVAKGKRSREVRVDQTPLYCL